MRRGISGVRRLALAFAWGAVGVGVAMSAWTAEAPSDLLCELMEHPEQTVITAVNPEFGWVYNPSFRGDVQGGYRIIVASSPGLAAAGAGDCWDSGLVTTSQSLNVFYAGAALRAGTNYFWRVRTADSRGQLGAFSEVQQFNTDTALASPPVVAPTTNGLKWVWYPETAVESTRYFRRVFVVATNVGLAGAQFLLTADNQFDLYVNGTWVGHSDNWKQFSLFSLGTLLLPGSNTLALAAVNVGASAAGITGKLQYLGADGSTNTVFVDETWRASRTVADGWSLPGYDDSAWVSASLLGGYGVSPWGTTAALPLTGVVYNASTNAWANRYPLRFAAAAPVLLTNTAPRRWFIDFGQDAFGYAEARLSGNYAGQTMRVRFGEMATGTAVNTAPSGTVRYASTNCSLQNGEVNYALRPPVFSGQTIDIRSVAGVVMPFRYLELTNCPGTVTPSNVVQQRLLYQFNDAASSFDSSSPALNRIWALCKYSIKATSFAGVYVDGDRERKPYEADAYINQLSHYAVDREFTLSRYTQEYLLAHPTWPTDWKFHSILMAWADYLQTGNAELLCAHYEDLKSKLFLSRARADGLIQGFPGAPQSVNSDIVDWPAGERDGFVITSGSYSNQYNSVINAFYYGCLGAMAQAAAVVGRTNDAVDLNARAAQVYAGYQAAFWNPTNHAYVDGVGTSHSSAHANFFPLAFGLVPETNRASVLAFLHTRAMAPSVYGAQYLLEALYLNGDSDYAFGLLTTNGTRGWLNMLNLGSTITTEAWDFSYKSNMDWNHAWGAAAGNLIPRYILGLRPLEPGYGRVVIQPQPARDLAFVEGTIPTIRGPVFIRVDNATNEFRLRLNLPGNVLATVMLPTKGGASPAAIVDGNPVSGTVSNGWLTLPPVSSGQHAIWLSLANPPSQASRFGNWQSAWFGADATNALAGPHADPDTDGQDNLEEFIADTNPLNAASCFRLNPPEAGGSRVTLTLEGRTGRQYSLERSPGLAPLDWIPVTILGIQPSNGPVLLADPSGPAVQAIYRARVHAP